MYSSDHWYTMNIRNAWNQKFFPEGEGISDSFIFFWGGGGVTLCLNFLGGDTLHPTPTKLKINGSCTLLS